MRNLLAAIFCFVIFLYAGEKQIGEYNVQTYKVIEANYVKFLTTNNDEIQFSGTYLIKDSNKGVME